MDLRRAAALGIGGAAAVIGAAVACRALKRDEEDIEAIPTVEEITVLKREQRLVVEKSQPEEERKRLEAVRLREEAVARLPKHPPHGCDLPEGAIYRSKQSFVPQVAPSKRRTNFPEPGHNDPATVWGTPQPKDYIRPTDGPRRWEWSHYMVVDEAQQLVSNQYEYHHDETGLTVLLIPTLRLSDAQFYDAVLREMQRRKAFVLMENLLTPPLAELLKKEQDASNSKDRTGEHPYQGIVRYEHSIPTNPTKEEQAEEMIIHTAMKRGVEDSRAPHTVGGTCVMLDYLQVLVQVYTNWMHGDCPLTQDEMKNIAEINSAKATYYICYKREIFLCRLIDKCMRVCENPEEWKKLTGQDTLTKVVAIPWNARDCRRIEEFLVSCRGFRPLKDKITSRIVFDPEQSHNFAVTAAMEDRATKDEGNPHELPNPIPQFKLPSASQPQRCLPGTPVEEDDDDEVVVVHPDATEEVAEKNENVVKTDEAENVVNGGAEEETADAAEVCDGTADTEATGSVD